MSLASFQRAVELVVFLTHLSSLRACTMILGHDSRFETVTGDNKLELVLALLTRWQAVKQPRLGLSESDSQALPVAL